MVMSEEKLYPVWNMMNARCHLPTHKDYPSYGARGITVCDAWRRTKGSSSSEGFYTFVSDMGDQPKGLSLDRRDNDGNYTPENCHWATRTSQSHNKRSAKGSASQYKGVFWSKPSKKWMAKLRKDGVQYYLGLFQYEDDAALAYNAKAVELYGVDACVNQL